jgi:type II secretory pathway component GspD/PulD (secretin)
VITDLSENIKQIKGLLKDIDNPPIQVSIEAKLVDIQSKDLRAIGVKYSVDYKDTDIFGSRGSTNTTAEEIKHTVDLATESSTLSGGQFVLNTFSLKHWVADATIDALISKQKAHLLASPSITTLNNHTAKIIIGEKVPYREETQTPVGTTETTRFIDVGTSLSVTPRVSDDGYVTMSIHPEVSSVSELLDAGPRITTREADTVVRVKDGETIVIGGLIKNENNGTRSRIPILGSLPLIGFLFSNKSEDKIQTELAVFITPHIIRPDRKASIETKFEPVNAEMLYNRAEDFLARLGVETWDKPKREILREAISLFEQLAATYPSSDKADDALYRAALIYYSERSVRDLSKARVEFKKLIAMYPNSEYVDRAASILKKIEQKIKPAVKR